MNGHEVCKAMISQGIKIGFGITNWKIVTRREGGVAYGFMHLERDLTAAEKLELMDAVFPGLTLDSQRRGRTLFFWDAAHYTAIFDPNNRGCAEFRPITGATK